MSDAPQVQHTPGPWLVEEGDLGGFAIRMGTHIKNPGFYAPHHLIEYVEGAYSEDFGDEWPEAQANARLIAAAPDLLAACHAALAESAVYAGPPSEAVRRRLRAAVAKAAPAGDAVEARSEISAPSRTIRGWIVVGSRPLLCAHCGHLAEGDSDAAVEDAMRAHMLACAEHPMREVERQRDEALREVRNALQYITEAADGLDEGAHAHACVGWDCARCGVNQHTGALREIEERLSAFISGVGSAA